MNKRYVKLFLMTLLFLCDFRPAHSTVISPNEYNFKSRIFKSSNALFVNDANLKTGYLYTVNFSKKEFGQLSPYLVSDKTPFKAFLIGLVPGFFIHGLGHYYIEENKAGTWLLVSEGVSLSLMYYAAVGSIVECEDCNRSSYDFAGYTGLVLFFGGWVVDFVDSPLRLARHKAKSVKVGDISLYTKNKILFLNYSIKF
jgi:hypothetical protein